MDFINSIIGWPLGWVMWALFRIVKNYGVSLLLFTIFSRLLMIPTTIRQQKSTARMAILQPQLQELQKKYANNKQKLQEEQMALYQKEGYNPMSGCLPLLIQFPIIFGLIDVIYKPLTHIIRLPGDVIAQAQKVAQELGFVAERSTAAQLGIVRGVMENPGAFQTMDLDPGVISDMIQKIQAFAPNLSFLGINLMETPDTGMLWSIFSSFNPVVLIPILSGATSLILSLITIRHSKQTAQGQAGAGGMTGMMLIMPIFSATFTLSVPAGVGLYWIYSNIVGVVQGLVMHKLYNPRELAEKARLEMEERRERERLERIELKKLAKAGELENAERALTQKELNRRKLAEARKRDAEKYGEDYSEDNA